MEFCIVVSSAGLRLQPLVVPLDTLVKDGKLFLQSAVE